MMWRSVLAGIVAAVIAAYGVYRLAYVPARCNRDKVETTTRTVYAYQRAMPYEAAVIGRENLDRLSFCRARSLHDAAIHVLAAANYDLLQNQDEAIAEYKKALALDERPEIYMQLAASLMAAGRQQEATEAYTRAATFNPKLIEEITSPVIAEEVKRVVETRESTLRR